METISSSLNEKTPTLIDFYADWCGPCITLSPIIEEVFESLKGQVNLLKVDVDEHKALAQKFGIRSVPTLLLFIDGKQVWRQAGLISKTDLKSVLTRNLK